MIDKEMLLKKRIELNHLDDYNNVKHIVFGVDSNYIKYAAVTMLSIVNYNQTTKIVFHVFCDEITAEDLDKLKRITEENMQISIIVYYVSNDIILEFPQNSNWNLSIYYRAIAPYVLHGKIKRALYLDADILCLGNLNDLFIMNLPSVVGVVEDGLGRKSKKKLLLGLGIPSHENYFNSGVMLIDIDRYVEEDILTKFIDCINKNADKLKMYDQDAFNIILGKEVYYLDKIYNLQTFMPVENKKIVFLHFIGSLKPWFLNVNRLGSDKWKEFYQKSPWCNIQLTDKQNLEFHDYRMISKYLWRNEEYQDSIIWYLKYLKKKLGC